MNLLEKTREFVKESFIKANVKPEVNMKHLDRTVYWIQQLKPTADEAMLIAAQSHDIERAVRKPGDKINKLDWASDEYYKEHQERGADAVVEFLKQSGAAKEIQEKVWSLVAHHEFGGNEDQNILKDADSISFFENNIPYFIEEQTRKFGPDAIKEKFLGMFNRLSLEKSKAIVKPWYDEALKKLEA